MEVSKLEAAATSEGQDDVARCREDEDRPAEYSANICWRLDGAKVHRLEEYVDRLVLSKRRARGFKDALGG